MEFWSYYFCINLEPIAQKYFVLKIKSLTEIVFFL